MKTRFFDETGRWYLKIIALLALFIISGCFRAGSDSTDYGIAHPKITIEGHDYIVFRMRGYEGCSAIHSESCPCHRKAERE
jgi:hypothetical protein